MQTERILPKVEVTDYKGNKLTNVIENFKYKYAEEGDDVCTFNLKSDSVFLSDNPSLQEGKRLTVKWGWSNGPMAARVVYIFDTETEYGEDGISMTITCHEKFALAKMDSVANKNLDQVKKGTPIIFSPTALDAVNISIENGNKDLLKLIGPIESDEKGLIKAKQVKGVGIVSYYNGNQSTFRGLRTFLDTLPGGPYVIDSRDDSVTVRTRNFATKSLRTFSYKTNNINGLLSFKPETKNRSKAATSSKVSVVAWDKENKTAVTQDTSSDDALKKPVLAKGDKWLHPRNGLTPAGNYKRRTVPIMKGGKQVGVIEAGGGRPMVGIHVNEETYVPPTTSGISNKGKLAQLLIKNAPGGINQKVENEPSRDLSKYDGKVVLNEGKYTFNGQGVSRVAMGTDYGTRQSTGFSSAVDNTGVAKNKFDIIVDDNRIKKTIIANEDPEKALAQAENERKNSELENNPATAKMEGDPSLESGKIITILGVAKRDSGNYYIKECEHTIDGSGYIVDISKMVRNSTNSNTASITSDNNNNISPVAEMKELPEDYEIRGNSVINTTVGPQASISKTKPIKSRPADIDIPVSGVKVETIKIA